MCILAQLYTDTSAFYHGFKSVIPTTEIALSHSANPTATYFYRANYPSLPVTSSIPTSIPPHDILAIYIPHNASITSPLESPLSDIIRIIQSPTKPKWILIEYIRTVLRPTKTSELHQFIAHFEANGYQSKYAALNTAHITPLPHNRDRLYIVASLDHAAIAKFTFPEKLQTPPRPITEFLDAPETIPAKYYYTEADKIYPTLKESIKAPNKIYQFRRYYVRENKTGKCPTLSPNMGRGGNNVPMLLDQKGIRKLTPRECFKLQGFSSITIPSGEKPQKPLADTHLYRLAGNSPNAETISKIAMQMVKADPSLATTHV
jgi:DNA (cytosine-5)-methyltransferase 1